jgi:hypothetical protein
MFGEINAHNDGSIDGLGKTSAEPMTLSIGHPHRSNKSEKKHVY